jgi:endonuclease/exonuclease/phosphatase (EEP) superfamily protein YafD
VRWARARSAASWAARLAAVGFAGAWLVALLPWWPFALLEHFRIQYVVGGLAVVAATAALRIRGWFDVALIATLVHAACVVPDVARDARPLPAGGLAVRVLLLNVHTQSRSFADVRRLIDDTHADIVGLVEVDDRWLEAIAPSVAGYAGQLVHPRDDNFGVALFTRQPLAGAIDFFGGLPAAVATVELGAARLGVIVVHPLPPMSSAALVAQRATLDAAAARARQMSTPVVMMGDFNATPWSREFRRVAVRSGLCDTRAGFGVQATFPANSPVLRIPIDHVLASCPVGVVDRRVERDVGSDHLPVVADLLIPP